MFAHAFDCGAERVELKCDARNARNARSRAAMRKFVPLLPDIIVRRLA